MTDTDAIRRRTRNAFVLLLVAAITAAFVSVIQGFLLALLMAAVFAALLYPLFLRVRGALGGRAGIAAALVLLLTLLAVILPLLAMLGVVAAQAVGVAETAVPWFERQIADPSMLLALVPDWVPVDDLRAEAETLLRRFGGQAGSVGSYLVGAIAGATTVTVGFVIDLAIMLYAMFFLLTRGAELRDAAMSLLPLAESDRTLILDRGLAITRVTLKSILIVGLLQGFLVGIALWAAGIGGAAFWGAVVVVLSAIPALGAPLVWLPAAAWLGFGGDWTAAIGLAAWGAVVVGSSDNLLRPWIVGREVQVPDLLILLGMLGGIASFGPLGILIGPILTALFLTALDIYRRAFADVLEG